MPINFYGVDKSTKLSVNQILMLEKAIGYNLATVKRRIHRMCYNFYDAGMQKDPDWEYLCSIGLAHRRDAFGHCCYRVSQAGIDVVGQITGAKIYQDVNMWNGEDGRRA